MATNWKTPNRGGVLPLSAEWLAPHLGVRERTAEAMAISHQRIFDRSDAVVERPQVVRTRFEAMSYKPVYRPEA